MIIIGGTYKEICFEPEWDEIYGSGFRAANLLLELDDKIEIKYYTFGDESINSHLKMAKKIYNNFKYSCKLSNSFTFYYDYPLGNPLLHPWKLNCEGENELVVESKEDILFFGLIESTPIIIGNRVIYDPQSPSNPILFSLNGSKAKQLIYVTNFSEASKLAKSNKTEEILKFFFSTEKVHCIIIKLGAKGAFVYKNSHEEPYLIPCFETEKVWTIGSGDIFSSIFAYNWFNGKTIEDSALEASKATAIYSQFKSLRIKDFYLGYIFKELTIKNIPKGNIYLAGPFFTFSQRWLVNEIRIAFLEMKLNVFSPFHDVGFGGAQEVATKDLQALEKASILFAIVDGLDSGTLFEIGYAISKGLKVICYVQRIINNARGYKLYT